METENILYGIRRQVYRFNFSQQLPDIFWSKSNATNIKLGIAWVCSELLGSLGYIKYIGICGASLACSKSDHWNQWSIPQIDLKNCFHHLKKSSIFSKSKDQFFEKIVLIIWNLTLRLAQTEKGKVVWGEREEEKDRQTNRVTGLKTHCLRPRQQKFLTETEIIKLYFTKASYCWNVFETIRDFD
jgi:hypothetical protein